MALRYQEEPSIGLTKLAQDALQECNGDRVAALQLLRGWINNDRQLYDHLIEPMIDDACAEALRKVDKNNRSALRAIVRTPNPDRGAAGIIALVAQTLHEFPLPGGKRLGDATPADVLDAVCYYREREGFMRREARWYELIHEAMQGGSCVEKVLSHDALARLRKRAEEE